jgi:hypothetical protein
MPPVRQVNITFYEGTVGETHKNGAVKERPAPYHGFVVNLSPGLTSLPYFGVA